MFYSPVHNSHRFGFVQACGTDNTQRVAQQTTTTQQTKRFSQFHRRFLFYKSCRRLVDVVHKAVGSRSSAIVERQRMLHRRRQLRNLTLHSALVCHFWCLRCRRNRCVYMVGYTRRHVQLCKATSQRSFVGFVAQS